MSPANGRRSGSVKQNVPEPRQAALPFSGLLYLAGLVQHVEPKLPFDSLKIVFATAAAVL